MTTRLDLQNWVKTSRGLDRAIDDGLLSNIFINEAIDSSLKKVADDCNRMRRVWFVDSGGTYLPLQYLTPEQLLDYRDPSTDTGTDPMYYSYPLYQARIFGINAQAPPVYDYILSSHVTTQHIFTVEDSGINLGKTLDGRRISPGDVVHNLADDSYGYIKVIDIITTKASGSADAGTDSDTLIDAAGDFVTNEVAVGDIICTPSSGVVTAYAFVTAVTATQLSYTDMRGAASAFSSGDTYKVGVANKIRLSESTPHPYLRDGARNYFSVGDAKATLTATTFTPTSVTGSATTGAASGDVAVASGGSHAKVMGIADNSLTVDWWVGGQPADAEEVVVKECDEYQVEGRMKDQRVMWISPTPSDSDDVGSESIVLTFSKQPTLPTADTDLIEIPDKYEVVLRKCLAWQCADLTGIYSVAELSHFEADYTKEAMKYRGDIWRPPDSEMSNAWRNRTAGRVRGVKDMTASGIKVNLDF